MDARDRLEHLLARAALGDANAFGPLYEATSAKLFGVCLRVLDDRGEAEEALQESYLRIWANAGRYQVNGLSPITWMAAVTRNLCIDRLRARRARERRAGGPAAGADAALGVADEAMGPEGRAVAGGEAARLRACLGELEPRRAEAVRRAYLDGESYAELAARFGVPLNTMRSWLRRSLAALRECLNR